MFWPGSGLEFGGTGLDFIFPFWFLVFPKAAVAVDFNPAEQRLGIFHLPGLGRKNQKGRRRAGVKARRDPERNSIRPPTGAQIRGAPNLAPEIKPALDSNRIKPAWVVSANG